MNGINDSLANPGRAPILRTKSVTKKEMNKCMAEIYDPGGIWTSAARLKSQYHNHWAKENYGWYAVDKFKSLPHSLDF